MYRCSNCDYLGHVTIETEDGEDLCPHCNEECFEFDEMTLEEVIKKENFFKEKLIPVQTDTRDTNPLSLYLWDDWDELNKFSKENKNIFYYTLISCEEDTMYISKGIHWANRIGYFLSYHDIPMEEGDIRYC